MKVVRMSVEFYIEDVGEYTDTQIRDGIKFALDDHLVGAMLFDHVEVRPVIEGLAVVVER